MKTPQACAPLLAVLVVSLATYAGDSWQNKPYTEWNEKEVRAVLEKSPWAHREHLMLVRAKSSQDPPCRQGDVRCIPGDDVTKPATNPLRRKPSPDEVQDQRDQRADWSMPSKNDGVAGTAVVRWASAQTVRDAMSRQTTKGEKIAITPKTNEPPPLPPSVAYIVYVDLRVHLIDLERVPRDGVFTTAMARNSSLTLKSTGERIFPVRVTSAPLPEFDDRKELAIAAYYIYFPRQKDGKSVLDPKETGVHFECSLARAPITSDFNFKSMKRDGTPDL